MKQLVLASNNPGKLREIAALLAPLAIEVIPQARLGIAEAEEPHDSFLENALAKARHASRASGLPALADDSGLCVDELGGAPGVHSAYYAGREGGREERDARNNAKLLASLGEARTAHYACVMGWCKARSKAGHCRGIWLARSRARAAQRLRARPLFLL
jgi:XTP/dITP diphosphohydrolase